MAVGNFENCLPIILHFEGGRSDNPADPGGRTNHGITQRTYDAYRDGLKQSHNDVYAITSAEVSDCYHRDYWNAIGGEDLPLGEDLAVFDFAVNSGPAHALRVWKGLNRDAEDALVIAAVCANRLAFMRSLPTWPHFGTGWARRVAQVQQHGLAMAAGRPTALSKVKPGHAGGVVVVAGGALAGFAHWLFGSPGLTLAIFIGASAIATYVWAKAASARQMAAAKAHVPPPALPQPAPIADPTAALEAAMVKVSAAKGALALAVADVLMERDALLKRGVDLRAEVAGAEAQLAALGVDIGTPTAQPGGQEQSDHAEVTLK
jgi:lysozyme family protein